MASVFLVFPHQLFRDVTPLREAETVYLVEEFLYFNQYKFHQQKILLHRASMQYYRDYLVESGFTVQYVEAIQPECDVRILLAKMAEAGVTHLSFYDVCDNWLEKRLRETCTAHGISWTEHATPLFLNTKQDLAAYFAGKKRYFQTDFYIQQRKKWRILVDNDNQPVGGKWSFDADNRLKYPKDKIPPKVVQPAPNAYYQAAAEYVNTHFSHHHGQLSPTFIYPTTHAESEAWLREFLKSRFAEFGDYEDAIVADEHVLHHGVLTPMLNVGLLTPRQIVNATLAYAAEHTVPLNSVEGFIRQIIGWREFIRGVYVYKGTQERTTNFWQFTKPLPYALYDGSTGLEPLDRSIQKALATGYNHHIERLMILGSYMLMAEIRPDDVYQWFMEMFIDAYDWVMVPNVYGMSQFADGGLMATKPYLSGSSYLLKMSNYAKGDWCAVWDALFWQFLDRHRAFFLTNPRLGMLVKTYDKMPAAKKAALAEVWAAHMGA